MSNFKLKLLAMLFMTIDHIGYFIPSTNTSHLIFRTIGRLSFPIFLFLILEGYTHTSNTRNYIKRLYIFAIISALPFYICFGTIFNVFFTLGTVVLMLHVLEEFSNCTYNYIIFLVFAYISFQFDWGLPAIITVFFLRRHIYDSKFLAIWVPIVLTLSTMVYFSFIGQSITQLLVFILPILGAIPILLSYNGELGLRLSGTKKYFLYTYYPLHLLIIGTFYAVK